jgi:hypothetical protein
MLHADHPPRRSPAPEVYRSSGPFIANCRVMLRMAGGHQDYSEGNCAVAVAAALNMTGTASATAIDSKAARKRKVHARIWSMHPEPPL